MPYTYEMVTEWHHTVPEDDDLALLDYKFDRTFRQICEGGWNQQSSGDVEAPTGYFYIVEIPRNDNEEVVELCNACEVGREYDDGKYQYPLPASGWYIVKTDSDGNWWVWSTRDHSYESVWPHYVRLLGEYVSWEEVADE